MFYEVLEIGKNTLIEIPKPRVTGSSPAYRSLKNSHLRNCKWLF